MKEIRKKPPVASAVPLDEVAMEDYERGLIEQLEAGEIDADELDDMLDKMADEWARKQEGMP